MLSQEHHANIIISPLSTESVGCKEQRGERERQQRINYLARSEVTQRECMKAHSLDNLRRISRSGSRNATETEIDLSPERGARSVEV